MFNHLKTDWNITERTKWIYVQKNQLLKLFLRMLNIFLCFNWIFEYFFFILWFLIVLCLEKISPYPIFSITVNYSLLFSLGYFHYQNNICSWYKFWKYLKAERIKKVIYNILIFYCFPSHQLVVYIFTYMLSYSIYKMYILILNLSRWL